MSVYVRPITELPIADALSGNETIIINDNGVVKQLPANTVAPEEIKMEQLSDELKQNIVVKDDLNSELNKKQDAISDDGMLEILTETGIIDPILFDENTMFVSNNDEIFVL